MAITFVQQAGGFNGSSTTTVSATFTSNQTAGNLNVLLIGTGQTGSAISTITDSAGNSYTQATTDDNGTGLACWLYYKANIASYTGTNQVTVTFTSSQTGGVNLAIAEYSGLATSSPLDGTPTHGDGFGTGTPASANLTTSNATDLVIGGVVGDSNQAFTAGTGYTSRTGNIGSFPICNLEDQITSATGTFTGNFTCGNQNWCANCVAFKTPGNTLEVTLPKGNINLSPVTVNPRLQGWTVRQSVINNIAGGGVNVFANFPQPVVAGNLIVIAALDKAGNAYSSASDSVGTTYAVATSQVAGGESAVIVYGNAAAAGSNTIGVNFGGATNNPNISGFEIIGATNPFPLDQVSSANGTGTSPSSGGVITNTNNDFLFGYLTAVAGMTGGATGWTQNLDSTSGTLTEYRTPLVSGSFSATGTSNSGSWLALLTSFLPGTGSGGPYRPQPPAGHINLINVVVTPRYPNALRITLNNPVPTMVISGAAHPHIPILPGARGNVILTAKVHGWLHIADQIFVTGSITARTVIRSPINTSVLVVSSVLTVHTAAGTLRPGPLSGTIGIPLHGLLVRLNPLRPLPPAGTINVAPVVVTVRYGALRVTLPTGRILVTLANPLNEELLLRPQNFNIFPALIRTYLGAAGRLMANISTLGPLTQTPIVTSGTVPVRPLGLFPKAHGTISVPVHLLNPEFSGTLHTTASGRINFSAVVNARLAGPQEITLPRGQILGHGVSTPRYIGVPPVPPEPPTGLCVIGSTATWVDNETEVSVIVFQSSPNPYFLPPSSSTSVPWIQAPVMRSLFVPFTDRFYRVVTSNSFGTSYSNISEQTPAPAGPLTVSAYGYYVILDVVGADLIMELHPGIDYSYVVQRVIAGPFPDYVSALNEQALINI